MKRQPVAPPCPGCGAQARIIKDGQSTCAYCGRTLEPLPFTHPGGTFAHTTWIRIGQKARIDGKEYVAVGRMQFQQNDDGEIYSWEEWLLLSQDGEARYLELDEGKWTLSGAFSPSDPPVALQLAGVTKGATLPVAGRFGQVTDAGVCRVSGIEGEIPWEVDNGDTVHYTEISVPGYANLSAEFDPSTGEVEWYRGRQMDEASVAGMFGRNDIQQDATRKENAVGDRRRFGCLTSILAIIALMGGCVGSGNGKVIAQGNVVAAQVPDEGQRFGPYQLTQVGHVHRLKVATTTLKETSTWVQAVLEDDQGGVVDTEHEMWDESGVDDDGSWHESDLSGESDFRLDKSGSYYVRVFADPDQGATNSTISFELEQGMFYTGYLIIFGIAGLIIGVLFWLAGSAGARAKLAEIASNADD